MKKQVLQVHGRTEKRNAASAVGSRVATRQRHRSVTTRDPFLYVSFVANVVPLSLAEVDSCATVAGL